jgi:hypothetical protein
MHLFFSDLNYKMVIFLSQTESTPKHFFFFRKKSTGYYYPWGSDKMSTLKCGKENIGLLIELFLWRKST